MCENYKTYYERQDSGGIAYFSLLEPKVESCFVRSRVQKDQESPAMLVAM